MVHLKILEGRVGVRNGSHVLASFSEVILNEEIPVILQVSLNNFIVCLCSFVVKPRECAVITFFFRSYLQSLYLEN